MRFAWVPALALVMACSPMPRLRPTLPGESAKLLRQCRAHFAQGTWQVVHTIEFRLPGGSRSALIGVVVGDSSKHSLRLVAMAPEGMTLLDVTSRGQNLQVRHAVPPFDKRPLVEGMVRDVRLMLFRPPGRAVAGRLPGGGPACRWRTAHRATVDVLLHGGRGWTLRQYNTQGRLIRTVRNHGPVRDGFAQRVSLVAHGPVGYGLTLRLVRVTRNVRH